MDLTAYDSENKMYTIPIRELNENAVRREITKNDKPHPLLILGIVIIVIIILYILYINAIKQNISGTWYDTRGPIKIKHNPMNDTFTIDNKLVGWLVGNALYIKVNNDIKMGVVYKRTIYWCGSEETWKRPIKAT